MSSFERRQSSDSGLQQSGMVNQLSPVDQVPFPETNAFPAFTPRRSQPGNANNGRASTTPAPEPYSLAPFTNLTQPLSEQDTAAHVTRILAFNASPLVTRQLPDVHRQTGTLNSGTTTSFRQPVIIQGTGKKSSGTMRPPRGRKWVISSAIFGVMVVVFLLTGFAVVPVETGNGHAFSSLPLFGGLFQNHNANNNPYLVEQAATATAFVRQDGYDPSSNNNNNNNGPTQTYSGPGVTPDRFAFGQCTYWADYEYHRLTGSYVDWIGNAYQWAYGASAAGWHVSSTPHVYSIIVLQAGVQGAGGYGHVAVVEKINPDGSVLTSNMNWYANGGWDTESWWTFYPGPGVTFVWK